MNPIVCLDETVMDKQSRDQMTEYLLYHNRITSSEPFGRDGLASLDWIPVGLDFTCRRDHSLTFAGFWIRCRGFAIVRSLRRLVSEGETSKKGPRTTSRKGPIRSEALETTGSQIRGAKTIGFRT